MLTRINAVPQSLTTYEYDNLNRIEFVSERNLSDPTNDALAQTTQLGYSSLGLLQTISRPNGITTTYNYNAPENPYWLTGIQHLDTELGPIPAANLAIYTYDYDNLGNRTSMTESRGGNPAETLSYRYDAANRLIWEGRLNEVSGEIVDTRINSYRYDRAGNRIESTNGAGQVTTYLYNENDQLTFVDKPNHAFERYTYDARGNVQILAGDPWSYSIGTLYYNGRDQLTLATINNVSSSYRYDHNGHRTRQTISSSALGTQTTNFLWDEYSQYGDVILESNASYQYERYYTLANGMLINQTSDNPATPSTVERIPLYFLADAQGTTRALTTSTGAIEQSYTYDAFGNLQTTIADNAFKTDYLYTGQQYDPYTDLYSLRARYYDPSIGRFMSRDTWAYDYGNPVELNRYVYTANNPVNFVDPSGYILEEWGAKLTVAYNNSAAVRFFIGGAVGAFFGALIGEIMAIQTFNLIESGACGSRTTPVDRQAYIYTAAVVGAFFGGVIGGGLAAGGYWSIAVAGLLLYTGSQGLGGAIVETISDAWNTGKLNYCAVQDAIDSLGAIWAAYQIGSNAFGPNNPQAEEPIVNDDDTPPRTNMGGSDPVPDDGFSPRDLQGKTPEDLINEGWVDITDPRARNSPSYNGNIDMESPDGSIRIRFDPSNPSRDRWGTIDHYHVHNPNRTSKGNAYLDIDGNPVPDGHDDSHIPLISGQRPR